MAITPTHPDQERLAGWSHLIDGVLHDLLPVGTRVALVNFPNHANAGDAAIWLGALASLKRMQVVVAYRASWATYEPQALRRALGDDGVVLLQGGGNFGDLYPERQQATRERVLADLADVRTIQLPQSLHFDDPANLDRMRRLCESHSDLTLLVREEASLAYAREHFDVPVELCPDLALALDTHPRVQAPRVDVLHLARSDKESTGAALVDPEGVSVERVDWLDTLDDEPPWPLGDRLRLRLNQALLARSAASPSFARNTWKDSAATFEPLARRWVARADEILARGRVVRTDRLHAHLLSLLQGIPHVIEDNATGKVKAFHDTWTQSCSLTHWADSPAEAAELARSLVTGAVEPAAGRVVSVPREVPSHDRSLSTGGGMTDRFAYLYDRIRDTEFEQDPFPHLYLGDVLREEHLSELLAAKEIDLPPAADLDELFDHLDAAAYERIDFPGCVRSKEEYVRWLRDGVGQDGTNPNCEAQGLAFRLGEAKSGIIEDLVAFFRSPELLDLLIDKFEITRPVTMEGGVQKYLHGYEISPHPDIRKKALTWMLNVNPMPGSEHLDIHTHYMRLRPERRYITELWRTNPQVETCWLPWAWCETVSQQTANNSLVVFSPRWDTIHAVRAHYDHLPAQRTQIYGNLWYDPADLDIRVRPGHEDLDFQPRGDADDLASVQQRAEEAEQRAAQAEARLDRILGNPAVRVARRARRLVRGPRGGHG